MHPTAATQRCGESPTGTDGASSALSEPGGEGLGTLGFYEHVAREMAGDAGFTRLDVEDFGSPINLYYELRP